MATWIVHLRIADILIKEQLIPDKYKKEFIYGSLAPDCGYGIKDSFGEFSPPPSITHWTPDGCKIFCEYNNFYNTYIKDKKHNDSYYFYLGYYVHLITDVLWSTSIYMPTRYKYAKEYNKDPMYLNTVKKDWYGLDYKFLSENPGFEPYKQLSSVKDVADYLPYYEPGQLEKQLKFISDYYKTFAPPQSEYKFLSAEEVDEFVRTSTSLIKGKIKEFTLWTPFWIKILKGILIPYFTIMISFTVSLISFINTLLFSSASNTAKSANSAVLTLFLFIEESII